MRFTKEQVKVAQIKAVAKDRRDRYTESFCKGFLYGFFAAGIITTIAFFVVFQQ